MSKSEFTRQIVSRGRLVGVNELLLQKVASKKMWWDSKSNFPIKDVFDVECLSKLDWWEWMGGKDGT